MVVRGANVSCSITSDSVIAWTSRLLCPRNSPGKNIGVGCQSLLQDIFLTQGSNPDLLHCRQILYQLSHQGKLLVINKSWRYMVTIVNIVITLFGNRSWLDWVWWSFSNKIIMLYTCNNIILWDNYISIHTKKPLKQEPSKPDQWQERTKRWQYIHIQRGQLCFLSSNVFSLPSQKHNRTSKLSHWYPDHTTVSPLPE